MSLQQSHLIAIAIALVLSALVLWRRNRPRYPLPPGPTGLPFVGNLFQLSPVRPHPQCFTWAKKYGPIFHLKLGPQDMIVLNTAEAANELLTNRSKIYSTRASPHVAHDIMGMGQRMVFLPYGREFKAIKKSMQPFLGPAPSKELRPLQDLESRVLLFDLLNHGDESLSLPVTPNQNSEPAENHWFSLVNRYSTSVSTMLVYGKRINSVLNNPDLQQIYAVVENVVHVGQPGQYLADSFRILRKLPDFLAPWRTEGRKMHDWEYASVGGHLSEIKTASPQANRRNSYVGSYLEKRSESGVDDALGCGLTDDGWMRDKMLAYSAHSILEAGSDTTAHAVRTFILFMLNYPDVLKRVREEVDSVVGSDRLPNFDDEFKLPYLIACIKETMRSRSPFPMAVPHSVEEDDVYNGYLIPKGSIVVGNAWAIQMDSGRFSNPGQFDPDRFYVKDGPVYWGGGGDAHERDHYMFGWGRRFCMGVYIAEASLLIVLSRLMWGFDFLTPTDPLTGEPIIPDALAEESFSDGFLNGPRVFNIGFHARSEKHTAIIRESFEDAQADFQNLGYPKDQRPYYS